MPRSRTPRDPDKMPPQTPPPPGLSERGKLMWLHANQMDTIKDKQVKYEKEKKRKQFLAMRAPPPTPRMRDSLPCVMEPEGPALFEPDYSIPASRLAPGGGILPRPLEEIVNVPQVIDGVTYTMRIPGMEPKESEGEESAGMYEVSSPSKAAAKESEGTTGKRSSSGGYDLFDRSMGRRESRREGRRAGYAPGDQGGVSLEPLTQLPPYGEQRVKPNEQDMKRPRSLSRKRGYTFSKLDAGRANTMSDEDDEEMTDNPFIRNYAKWSSERLYAGAADGRTMHMKGYPLPTRDMRAIGQAIHDMTVNEHKYRPYDPPPPVVPNSVNYFTDATNVQDPAVYKDIRKEKASAGLAMFTERDDEIKFLNHMQQHGLLKDGVKIHPGYQAEGPHGSRVWLTVEGQAVGGKLREKYEQQKAEDGTFPPSTGAGRS